ncbi:MULTISPECIES: DUF5655 domain-containing protein [unclassified Imperialibacter]|uniref:DUF5655 domain-containing protein n=1 Tax=unclassified Imperialibacter TaxID=2629706 RepID=UPI00125B645E|nr:MULTISPECIES: DUF5655 domain-containing protein [unclassified Imperialibacter]CAD5265368.1 conserved hypothetical protein [Imperialibacter sp. 89]CAD5270227.1 conserved hypothetical protein [Imperialibacter sp. 75]VVT09854.1 conserved hypothetical protein [Imperialibacter sp. EC-SDR9]
MKAPTDTKPLWVCPKCGRRFQRQRQAHSCNFFPLDKHFERKPVAELLYDKFETAVKRQVGSFKVESLKCCIHFVSSVTFAAVFALRDRIRVDFALNREIKSERLHKEAKLSAHRYLYLVEIKSDKDIDKELLQWIHEAAQPLTRKNE